MFVKDGYGPGDTVRASLHVERAEGGVPEGAQVEAIARVDGAEVHRGSATIDAEGNTSVSFALPELIERGDGTLAMVIRDGGVVETATKTIPILLRTLDLAMYPEGGDLVAGLPTRVYVEGRTPAGKPADIEGAIVDSAGRQVATLATAHDGRGRFDLVPAPGESYALVVSSPSGIEEPFPLPDVRGSGGVAGALGDVVAPEAPVRLRVGATKGQELTVSVRKREVEVGSAQVSVSDGELREVEVPLTGKAEGVLIATLWGETGLPLAERLVFRRPAKQLQVEVEADRDTYAPGEEVKLTVTTRDPSGEPVGAVVGLTVTDDAVLEMLDKREQAPRLPAMVLLEPEVQELADAHVYLDPEDELAPVAVDLLLGTQGWRRFALLEHEAFIAEHGADAKRALAYRAPEPPPVPMAAPAGGAVLERLEGEVDAAPPPEPAAPEPEEVEAEMAEAQPAPDAPPQPEVAGEPHAQGVEADQAKVAVAKEVRRGPPMKRKPVDDRARGVVAVREYAHEVRPGRQPGQRIDFTETLYWTAAVRTDAETGEAQVTFGLSDAVTGFRAQAGAFDADGALGTGGTLITSVEPFHLEPKVPLEVTSGDVVKLPVAVANGTADAMSGVTLTTDAGEGIDVAQVSPVDLPARSSDRRLVELRIGDVTGERDLRVEGSAGAYSDRVTHTLKIKPLGFPAEVAYGGMLGPGKSRTFDVTISDQMVPGTLVAKLDAHPTPLARLTGAFERLIREPYGCFEQTSSTTYPLVMAQQYFTSHQGVDPALIERSSTLLDKSYQRLTGFECDGGGYEWFGKDPAHEALTAYGLMEFLDMAEVRAVDREMLARTRTWLLGQRDGEGGFKRERRALHTWVTDPDSSNGYILWALLQAIDPGQLREEVAALAEAAKASDDSYVHALAANALALAGRDAEAKDLLGRLAEQQQSDGRVDGGRASIVGSGGEALIIETTSLAVLAWLNDPAFASAVERGVRYLAEVCKGGRFGSTQSTVLALKAIVAYDKSKARPKAAGTLRVAVDGQDAASVSFDKDTQGIIELPDLAPKLGPGKHTIEVSMDGGSEMPVAGVLTYADQKPASSEACAVRLTTALPTAKVDEGGVTEMDVTVKNTSKEPIPTPVAIIGLPGGLEPRHDQLKELVEADRIAAYEVLGREVVLYWRSLKGSQKVELPISLVAAIPGTYTGPASRAYLYYTDEHKHWVDGAKVEVVAQR